MKMAKATERDLEAALAVCRVIEALQEGQLPDDMTEGDDIVWYDERKHAVKVVEHLKKTVGRASLFRVCFGMSVLLDPANEIVDPDASALEHHPKVIAAMKDAESYRGLLLWTLYHHQGGSSDIGQKIRKVLGIGQFDHMTPEQITEAKKAAGFQKGARL